MSPLILTLALNPEAEQFFDQLRRQHFPPERNFLAAHLTLFHHLPPDEDQILNDIKGLCETQRPITLQVTGVMHLGRGVAYKLESMALKQTHARLQQQWWAWLTPQDRQPLRPHVTVQNKVPPQQAQALLQQLHQSFAPFEVQGTGLQLWKYLGGPWERLQLFAFTAAH